MPNGLLRSHNARDVELQIPAWGYSNIVKNRQHSKAALVDKANVSVTKPLLLRADLPLTLVLSLQEFQSAVTSYYQHGLSTKRFQNLHRVFSKLKGTRSLTVDRAATYVFSNEEPVFEEKEFVSWKDAPKRKPPTPGELAATLQYLRTQGSEFFRVRGRGPVLNRTGNGVAFGFQTEHYRADTRRVADFLRQTPGDRGPRAAALGAFLGRTSTLIEHQRDLKDAKPTSEKNEFLPTDRRLLLSILRGMREPHSTPFLQSMQIIRHLAHLYPGKALTEFGKLLQLSRDVGLVPPWDETHDGAKAALEVALAGRDASQDVETKEETALWTAMLTSWSLIWARRLLGDLVSDEEERRIVQRHGRHHHRVSELPGHELGIDSLALRQIKGESDVLKRLTADSILPSGLGTASAPKSAVTKVSVIRDAHADVRERYSHPVYVIDEPTAHELDDGISIAEAQDGEEHLSPWIEMHIADPTTWLGPDHPLSLLAQQRWTSIYLPNGHLPMLPDSATSRLLDLRDRDAQLNGRAGRYALTFSGRLNLRTGDLAAYRVRCTFLENVVITSYDTVDSALQTAASLTNLGPESLWGQTSLPRISTPPLPTSPADKANLERIFALALRHRAFRTSKGAYQPDQSEYVVTTQPQWLDPAPFPYPPVQPVYPGSSIDPPAVKLKNSVINHLSPSHILVSECMIMAGRIAARYCHEHGVPVIYRGQPSILDAARLNGRVIQPDPALDGEFRVDPDAGFPPLEQLESIVEDVMSGKHPETGTLSFFGLNRLLPYMPASVASLEPIAHYSMGLSGADNKLPSDSSPFVGYTRATSPLRRFADMLLHWNVKAHLLGRPPPFSKADLERLMLRGREIETIVKYAQLRANRYWGLEWVRRREVLSRFGKDPMMKVDADPVERITMPAVDPRHTTVPYTINAPLSMVPGAMLAPQPGRIPGEPDLPGLPPSIEARPVYTAYVTACARFEDKAQVSIVDLGGMMAKLPTKAPRMNGSMGGNGNGDSNRNDNGEEEGTVIEESEPRAARYKVGDKIRVVVEKVDPFFSILNVRDVEDVQVALDTMNQDAESRR